MDQLKHLQKTEAMTSLSTGDIAYQPHLIAYKTILCFYWKNFFSIKLSSRK